MLFNGIGMVKSRGRVIANFNAGKPRTDGTYDLAVDDPGAIEILTMNGFKPALEITVRDVEPVVEPVETIETVVEPTAVEPAAEAVGSVVEAVKKPTPRPRKKKAKV
jgi:hypothetical protein